MVKHVFVGVDGGASKCRVRVEDDEGKLIGFAKGHEASIRFSPQDAWDSILQTLDLSLQGTGLSLSDPAYHFHAGMGLAGTEIPEACYQFSTITHPFKTLILKSDGYIACVGAHSGNDGSIISVGTGIVAWQIEGEAVSRISGWGFPHDDEGSGAWMGLEAVRRTIQWYDGCIEGSPLYEAVLAKFNHNFLDLVVWANRDDCHSTDFASIAPIVVVYAHEKEPVALSILREAAQYVDHIHRALLNRRTNANHLLPCVLMGGLARFIEPFISESLKSQLAPCQREPVEGAILMVKRQVKSLRGT